MHTHVASVSAAVSNAAAVNTGVHRYPLETLLLIFEGRYPDVGLQGHKVVLLLKF